MKGKKKPEVAHPLVAKAALYNLRIQKGTTWKWVVDYKGREVFKSDSSDAVEAFVLGWKAAVLQLLIQDLKEGR